jgi:putative ABC transport system substrate-binding protein
MFGVQVIPNPTRGVAEIDRAIAGLAGEPKAGLIVNPDAFTTANRGPIISLAARYRLPAIYAYRYFAADGGLLSYGHDPDEPFRAAPSYIDKIFRGAIVGDLPVQQPTKFELVINLKTAKALGLDITPGLLSVADDLIE